MPRIAFMMVLLFAANLSAAPGPNAAAGRLWLFKVTRADDTINGKPVKPREETSSTETICWHASLARGLEGKIDEVMTGGVQVFDFVGKDGKLSFHGTRPVDKEGDSYDIDATGTFSDERLSILIHMQGIEDGDRIEATGHIEGSPVKAC